MEKRFHPLTFQKKAGTRHFVLKQEAWQLQTRYTRQRLRGLTESSSFVGGVHYRIYDRLWQSRFQKENTSKLHIDRQ